MKRERQNKINELILFKRYRKNRVKKDKFRFQFAGNHFERLNPEE